MQIGDMKDFFALISKTSNRALLYDVFFTF
jgi:hypothetical protein